MTTGRRALVLGGGGITGIAWEIGMLAGLAEAGIELNDADLVIGTSAGSVVGARLRCDAPIEELYESQLVDASGEQATPFGGTVILRYFLAGISPGGAQRARAWIGRRAARVTGPDRRGVFEALLRGADWPEKRFLVTAVEAETGEAKVFDRDSGVPMIDAVAASCAVPLVWPAVTIDGKHYVDGGLRSPTNADLATDHQQVVVLAPVVQAFRRSQRVATLIARLGADVHAIVVSPDLAAKRAIGRNVLDPANRAAAARAGRKQAHAAAPSIAVVWHSL